MRKYYLDNLRWMTVVIVVIYHVIYMYNGIITDIVIGSEHSIKLLDGMQYVLYPWFMVLLFIIAGMCSRYYLENHTAKEFLKSRTIKLLVPSTLGLLVYGWIQGYISMSITNAFVTIPDTVPAPILYLIMVLSGTGVLWFIQVLWVNSLILFFIRKFEKGKLHSKTSNSGIIAFIICGILFYISGLVLNTPIIAVYRFGVYGFTFFLGYFVLAHEEVIKKLSRLVWWLLGSACILGGVYVYLYFGENFAVMPVVGSLPAALYAYVMSLALLGIGYRYLNKTNIFMDYMRKRSFGIYMFHYLILSGVAFLLEGVDGFPMTLKYILVLVAAFVGSICLYEVISRIPVLRFLILGMRMTGKKEVK